jgi:aspartate racemase
MSEIQNKKLGIIGGMGPLASTEFLYTIYQNNIQKNEQQSLDVILFSISSVPDRTGSILKNSEQLFIDALLENCGKINELEVDKIVICCFTSHHFFSFIPQEIRRKIISLVDITHELVAENQQPSLLLASKGSYLKQVFTSGNKYGGVSDKIIIPAPDDQDKIHSMIYDTLKPGHDPVPVIGSIRQLLEKYKVQSCIAGCTEFHLLNKYINEKPHHFKIIDPLQTVAQRLHHYMKSSPDSVGITAGNAIN